MLGTLQTMSTPNGIKHHFPFIHASSLDEHVVHHTCGAHFLSWSPTLQPKYKLVAVIEHFLEANVTSLKYSRSYPGYLRTSGTFL
jgi:hypothetical protein